MMFAGEYTDAESGLIYLRARYYDPATALFLTVDPLVSLTRDPYGYADGDPYLNSDPSGRIPQVVLLGAAVGAVIGGASSALSAYASGASGWEVASAAVGGVVGGGLGGACVTLSVGMSATCGAATSVLGTAVTDLMDNRKLDSGEKAYLTSVSLGALSGAVGGKMIQVSARHFTSAKEMADKGILNNLMLQRLVRGTVVLHQSEKSTVTLQGFVWSNWTNVRMGIIGAATAQGDTPC